MAIVIESTFHGQGATLENYDRAVTILGGTPGGPYPDPGCLFHWVTGISGGFRITNVFKTKQGFETFAAEKLGPVRVQVGLPQPQNKFIDVARFMTAGS